MNHLVFSLVGLMLYCTSGTGSTAPIKRHLPEPARPVWFKTDLALQTPVSLDVEGRPLRVVFSQLSKKSKVALSTSREIAEFRISIHAENQPLSRVMGRLLDTFGHGKLPTNSHYWARIENEDKSLQYVFGRTRRGIEEEEALLDYPRMKATQWLKELRNYARMDEAQRKATKSDHDYLQRIAKSGKSLTEGEISPVGEPLASLTDAQIESLVQEGKVRLPGFAFSPEARSLLDKEFGPPMQGERGHETDFTSPMLTLVEPHENGNFLLELSIPHGGTYTRLFGLDTLDVSPARPKASEADEQGEVIDLFAHEKPPLDREDPTLLATYLRLLAQEAHLSLCAEIFLKETPYLLSVTRGKPEFLLSEICRYSGCDWRKVGEDYIVWSKTWAQDRAADVSDTLLERWRKAQEKQGCLVLEDLIAMSSLPEAKIPTLVRLFHLPTLRAPSHRNGLVFVAVLSPTQRKAAYTTKGIEVHIASAEQRALLQKVFRRPELWPPVRLKLERLPRGMAIYFSDREGKMSLRWISEEPRGAPDSTSP